MDRSKSISLLNTAGADELRAVHQYTSFHFHLDDQGLGPLSNLFKRTAIEEMMHVERLADRVLFCHFVFMSKRFTKKSLVNVSGSRTGWMSFFNSMSPTSSLWMEWWVRRTGDRSI